MKLAPIFSQKARRPSPKPVQVDLRRIFIIGTIVWFAALIFFAILEICGVDVKPAIGVSASGVAIGIMLLIWEFFNRWNYRRLAE
ncbi:DUF2530 domain-containing protein [Bifidobacterium aquikefiri]|uniref:DUF2530 domain-containing protein n=2 Tax=Bifidobacterium aquikefiri TaxID=1653207 RepID=A0A261G758_9BIFI|nr:DUF2530 domain-containing protein [Bifidobacterium aquikefiri]OZG67252.1 hypothetical protein BAQU_1325 [Bifidobacterium aquikefiri]